MPDQPVEIPRANSRLWITLGWFVVAFHALLYAGSVFFYGLRFWPKMVVLSFCLLAVIGCWRKWGLAILLSFAAFYFGAFYFRAYPYTHNAREAMMEDIGFPTLFAFTGLLIGAALEMGHARSKRGQGG